MFSSGRLMSDVEVKAFDDIMQDAAKKHLGLDVSRGLWLWPFRQMFLDGEQPRRKQTTSSVGPRRTLNMYLVVFYHDLQSFMSKKHLRSRLLVIYLSGVRKNQEDVCGGHQRLHPLPRYRLATSTTRAPNQLRPTYNEISQRKLVNEHYLTRYPVLSRQCLLVLR